MNCGKNQAALQSEIVDSKSDLEHHLGKPVNFFAFPFGKRENMSAQAVALAGSAYSHFVSSFGGENLPQKGQDRQHLLRKNFHPNLWELELELQSVFDLRKSREREFPPGLTWDANIELA